MKLFDEKEAIWFIRSKVAGLDLSEDEIWAVIDAIYDYYDENGELDIDFDEDENDFDSCEDETEIIKFVTEATKDMSLPSSVIADIVKAELAYEQSLL